MSAIPQMCLKLLACAFLLGVLAAHSLAQQNTSSIKGTVKDQLGSLIVNATVFARDAPGVEKKTTTNSSGAYEFRALASGNYDLRVVAVGFNLFEARNVEVTSGKTATVDIELTIASVEQSVTIDEKGVSTDPDRNADTLVLRGRDLETLPNDPAALAATLQSLAGPPQDENGPQMKVDGFSNGQVPPKEAIREVRINNNPYSAENEYPGWGGIEIYTQPGSEKFHGGGGFNFNDESLNSRNPYSPVRAPFQQRAFNLNLTGPIVKKRASFAFYMGRYATDSNSIVVATTLDPASLRPVLFNQSFVTPQVSKYISARGDVKINKKHTLVANYEYNMGSQNLQGIGGFSLPSRAYNSQRSYHTLQVTETAVLNEKTINETRLQLSHSTYRQTANTNLPALNVLDSFFGGGAQVGSSSNKQDRMELQNFTSWSSGRHFLKVGGRLRYVRITSISPANFGGTYTFAGGTGPALDANDQVIPGAAIEISSLERYRRTLLFQRQNLGAAQIRNLGGGATQFSIAGGNPQAQVAQTDFSFYAQDEWKLRPNLTISPGLRYENQTNISSNWNLAPRIGFAWAPSFGSKKKPAAPPEAKKAVEAKPATAAATTATAPPKPAASPQPKSVLRGGFGIFYNRISEDNILQTLRFNGLNQQQFVVSDPSVLDLFPVIPSTNLLDAFAQPQTRRFLSQTLAPSIYLRASFSFEHQLPHNLKLAATYYHTNLLRTLRTVNINAPLAGTYNPAIPSSGVRPLGQSAGNILEFQSTGHGVNNAVSVSLNGRFKKGSFWSGYNWSKNRNTDNGTSGSSFDAYDFSNEWAPSPYGLTHYFYAGGNYQGPLGVSVNTFMIATAGPRFNITTGRDTNGDTFFSERPAFATDLTKPGVIVTPIGAFDPNPSPGQPIIPRNYGKAPGFVSFNMGLEKTIKFGRAIPPKAAAAPAAGSVVSTTSPQRPPAKQPIQRPYSLGLSMYVTNLLNHTNQGIPVGNMSSPFFLKSTGISSRFFFGPGLEASGNRQVTLNVRFRF